MGAGNSGNESLYEGMSFSDKEKSHRRTVSASDSLSITSHGAQSKSENQVLNDSLHYSGIIGQASNSKKNNFIQGLSATWSGKPPKVPKPEQTQVMFNVIDCGLREIIKITQNDLASLKLAVENTSVSSHQIKAAERYLKKLECHLAKLDELQEKYEVQRKMRDGIRSMAYAYILSHGKERESALHNVHSGYKECNELLCSYESKLEQMMGTFVFEMIGIQGFARLCCGDVFEIVVKHGEQKWKSRGHVLKNKQTWENKRILFKALFCEPLYIKAVEVRGLGKNILLGNKYCETKVLFSAYSQQMTINLNPSGSLKLNIIITWNPVHGGSEESSTLFTRPSIFGSQSVLNQVKDHNAISGRFGSTETLENCSRKRNKTPYDNTTASGETSFCESVSTSTFVQDSGATDSYVESVATTSVKDIYPSHFSKDFSNSFPPVSLPSYNYASKASYYAQNSDFQNSEVSSGLSANSSECNSIEMASSSECSVHNVCKLQDHLYNVIFSLEKIYEQYPDLKELYDAVEEIDRHLKLRRQTAYGSDVSISVKNALCLFDFLDTAVDDDLNSLNDKDEKTSKTPSSEKSFMDTCENNTRSTSQSPQPLTSGIDHLDTLLIVHIEYCLRLVENLCSCSPLKCLEVFSLDKLRRQSYYFDKILRIIRKKEEGPVNSSEFFFDSESNLKMLWLNLAQSDGIITTAEQFCQEIEKTVQSIISNVNTNIVSKVSQQILCKIFDRNFFSPETVLTVAQFRQFFINQDLSFDDFVKRIATEVVILEDLKSREPSKMPVAFATLKTIPPYNGALLEVSLLLLEKDPVTKSLAVCYLKSLSADFSNRTKAIETYLEGLESDIKKLRQGSCSALQILEAYQCSEQLTFIAQNDESHDVRLEAKMSLLSLGKTGQILNEGEK